MNKEIASWLHGFLSDIKYTYFRAALSIVLSALGFVGFAYYVALFFDKWIDKSPSINLLFFAGLAYTLRFLFNYYAILTYDTAADKVVEKAKAQLFRASLDDQTVEPSTAVNLLTNNIHDIKPYFANFIPQAIASILVSVLLLGFICYVDLIVGIILFLSLLLIPLQMIAVGYGAESVHKQHADLFLRYSSIFYNRIKAIGSIQNLGIQQQEYKLIGEKSQEVNAANMKVMKIAMLSSTFMEFFVTLSIAIVALYLGMSLLGYMPFTTSGQGYSSFNALFLLLLTPYYYLYLRKLVSAYHDRNQAFAVGELVLPFLQLEHHHSLKNTDSQSLLLSSIRIADVSYTYTNNQHIALNALNFKLPSKGLIWLSGISGSGKSTLLKLLTGFLTVQKGEIIVNDLSSEDSNQWLIENSNYFNQRTFIFEGTIGENIAMKSKLSTEQLQDIIWQSGLQHVLAKKSLGLDSKLTNNGIQISAGERQLLGFARLLANPKPILLLDEPTANLDKATRTFILEKLKLLSEDHLLIIASHEQDLHTFADDSIELSLGLQR